MSGRRQNDGLCRPLSQGQTRDEDPDFQYALKLSADLNGDLSRYAEAVAAAAKQQAKHDADFGFAVQMQSDGRASSSFPGASASSLKAPQGLVANTSAIIVDTEAPVEQTFKLLSDFQDHLKASECAKCGRCFLKSESDVTTLFKEWYEGKSGVSSLLECKTCGISSCIVCPSATFSRRSLATFEDKSASWCCTDGRLLLIWILLCGFDISYCEMRATSAARAEADKPLTLPQPTEKGKGKIKGKGKGKAKADQSAQRSGIGYGGSDSYSGHMSSMGLDELYEDGLDAFAGGGYSPLVKKTKKKLRCSNIAPGRTISDNKSQTFQAQQAIDRLATMVLGLLERLLPSLDRGHAFDMNPPPLIADMLLASRLLDYCGDLLHNDSLDDPFSRNRACNAVVGFVKTIGTHYITAGSTVFSNRPQQPELCNLLTQTYHHTKPTSEETVRSIADDVRELSKLSELLLKNAEHHKTTYNAGSDQELLLLCRKISGLWKILSLSAHISTPEPESSNSAAPNVSAGVANIRDVTDDEICASHAFATKAQAQVCSVPGRFKRLVFEINMLKTSLPPNIYVRHGESRLDVMKCAIIGPADTPYENGIFEFDMYCPSNYPNNPPEVSFKGTGGGVHGINPNLYADGKVCLSLLGTWAGEPWKPGESTLLQVLVSLQAMVFCEQPWFNEPGRESSYGSGHANSASEAYNRKLRELTVRLAMISWLESTPSIWKDVVEQHFESNADEILRTVIEWSKQSEFSGRATPPELPDYLQVYHGHGAEMGYRAVLPRLGEQLRKYGATVVLPEFPQEDTEPQSKKARVEGSRAGEVKGAAPSPASGPVSPYPGLSLADYDLDEVDGFDTTPYINGYNGIFGSLGAPRGGYRGPGSAYPSYSFRGRGHVLGARPGGGPEGGAEASGESAGGVGGGRGRGSSSWLDSLDTAVPHTSVQDFEYNRSRRPGDVAEGLGRGGRGGRGGGDGSKAGGA